MATKRKAKKKAKIFKKVITRILANKDRKGRGRAATHDYPVLHSRYCYEGDPSISLAWLAKEYNIPYRTLIAYATKYKWTEERKRFYKEVEKVSFDLALEEVKIARNKAMETSNLVLDTVRKKFDKSKRKGLSFYGLDVVTRSILNALKAANLAAGEPTEITKDQSNNELTPEEILEKIKRLKEDSKPLKIKGTKDVKRESK